MPPDTAVPFHAAGKPGIPERQIARLEHIVDEEQFPLLPFVEQGPEPPAQLRQKSGFEGLVLQHGRRKGLFPAAAVIKALHLIRQHRVDAQCVKGLTVLLGDPGTALHAGMQ